MKIRRSANWRPKKSTVLILAISTLLASCGGGSGDSGGGGIIGTGMTIEGTVPTNRAFASNNVTLKAKSGERSTAAISANGRFSATSLPGEGPYLMQVDLGNGDAYYSVAYPDDEPVVQNIHAYSDVSIRNWFATHNLDIDDAFSDSGEISELPTSTEISIINDKFRDQIAAALQSNGLENTDLQTVSFDANDTGVDQFLDQNPVLISTVDGNVFITIIIKDPETGTQSTVVQNLVIDIDLTVNDVIPPNAPTALRVLPSASDEIVLAWNPASDNIGVSSYEVSRDGVVIATTPYPVFVDSPLAADTVYAYSITAVDATGNRSLASESGSSATLSEPDILPPPAPTGLQLTPGASSIDVRWVQTDIADVASFTVLRAIDDAMLDNQVRVTSTQLVDAGLNSGTRYCYQVIANDASENASDPSSQVCTVTSGSNVTGDDVPETPVDPDGDRNAHLVSVDVSSLPCTEELDVRSLTGEARITAGCYQVNDNISLDETNLTIDSGVVLKFGSRNGIRVSDDSSLAINGTQQNPVVLTGQQRTAGYWSGVNFVFSNNVKNSLQHVVVEYAGSGGVDSGAVASVAGPTLTVRLKLSDVLMRHSGNHGFLFLTGTILDQFDGITATQNEQSGQVSPAIAGMFGSDLELTGNTTDAIQLTNTRINSAMTLRDPGVPFHADVINVDAPVEIGEGVTLAFAANKSLRVEQDGSLRVSGTPENPVLFTGIQATPGYWTGLQFVFSNSVNNELKNLTIEYGGSGTNDAANLSTTSAATLPVLLKLENVELRHSAASGFHFEQGTSLSQFTNVTSTLNENSGYTYPTQLTNFGTGNDFTGNTFDRVTLLNGTIEQAQTWPALNVPVRFNNLTIESAWTLSAGLDMVAGSGALIRVSQEGSMAAAGTAGSPIILRGEQQNPGYWQGINFVFSNSTLNVLDHVQISDAGSGAAGSNGNIELTCGSTLPSMLSISNTLVSNSASWGILLDDSGCSVNVGANVTYSNNVQGDISN